MNNHADTKLYKCPFQKRILTSFFLVLPPTYHGFLVLKNPVLVYVLLCVCGRVFVAASSSYIPFTYSYTSLTFVSKYFNPFLKSSFSAFFCISVFNYKAVVSTKSFSFYNSPTSALSITLLSISFIIDAYSCLISKKFAFIYLLSTFVKLLLKGSVNTLLIISLIKPISRFYWISFMLWRSIYSFWICFGILLCPASSSCKDFLTVYTFSFVFDSSSFVLSRSLRSCSSIDPFKFLELDDTESIFGRFFSDWLDGDFLSFSSILLIFSAS